jgi:DNA-binding NarL/FixJ family response regulator
MDRLADGQVPISLLISVAVRLYRDGLTATLSAHPHLRIAGTAATALETQHSVRLLQPDIVIIDVSFDDILGLMRAVRTECKTSRILAFAVREDITTILDYAGAGADGFVTASGSVTDLVDAIERTWAGELRCSPRIAAQLLRRAAHQAGVGDTNAMDRILTGREQQVFSLMKQGRSNKEIAKELTIAEATVKNHVHHVLEKLHVTTRGAAAAVGLAPLKATLSNSILRPSS